MTSVLSQPCSIDELPVEDSMTILELDMERVLAGVIRRGMWAYGRVELKSVR